MIRNNVFLYFVFLLFPILASAQVVEPVEVATLFDHWYTNDTSMIEIKVVTNLGQLFRNKSKEEYQEAAVTMSSANLAAETYKGKIRLRGNIRREICLIPPLKLKFKKKHMTSRGWLPHNDLKLVVPCSENSSNEQYLVGEYLTYRMYEKISPLSLRVQKVRLLITDSENKKADRELLAFIIEPIETLAARFNLQEIERSSYRETFLEKPLYRQMAFFEYMIGNTDWNVYNGHNLYFMAGAPFKRMVAVPYDFDYSAVVGTHYAVPHESLPIKAVTQRLYRGLSCDEEEALELIETFGAKKEDILEPIMIEPLLEEGQRKKMLRYLEGFFKQLGKTKGLISELKR